MKKILLLTCCFLFQSGLQAQNKINFYEYWFDNDFNAKVSSNITPVSNYTLNGNIPTTGLPYGLHVFNIRFKDDSSKYSHVLSSFFYKNFQNGTSPQNKITSYEFWYDDNYALKSTANITPSQSFNLNTNLSAGSLAIGLHVMNIRFKDLGGKWSQVTSHFFYKGAQGSTAQNNMIKYEYWYDDNFASKVSTTVTAQQNLNLLNNLGTNTIPVGLHTLNIRFLDMSGKWSQVLTQFFNKTQSSLSSIKLITNYQYWYDNDFSNRMTQQITPVANYNLVGSLGSANIPIGLHTMNIRFKDTNNLWSQVVTQLFYKTQNNSIVGGNRIVGYRYWTDSNFSNATYIKVSPAVTSYQLIANLNMSSVPKGARTFNIQFKDTTNKWSVVQSDSFYRVPKPIASFYANQTSLCDSGLISFINNSNDMDIYHWDFGDGDTSNLALPTHNYTSLGNYNVTLTAKDTLSNIQDDTLRIFYIKINPTPIVNSTATSTIFCAGNSTTLSASGANSYKWSPGSYNGASITVSPSSTTTYTVTGTNASGCSSTSTKLITVKPLPNTIITATPSNTVCTGSSVSLTASGANSYTWSGGITNGTLFTPSATSVYSVTAIATNGCSKVSTKTVWVGTCASCNSNIVISTSPYSILLTESTNFIVTNGTVKIDSGYYVKLDAAPNSYVKLNPGFSTTSGSVFVAEAYNGCTAGSPSLAVISENKLNDDANESLLVYPNPTTGKISIEHPSNLKEINLYELSGKRVMNVDLMEGTKTDIDVGMLPSGVYILEAKGYTHVKIIKN